MVYLGPHWKNMGYFQQYDISQFKPLCNTVKLQFLWDKWWECVEMGRFLKCEQRQIDRFFLWANTSAGVTFSHILLMTQNVGEWIRGRGKRPIFDVRSMLFLAPEMWLEDDDQMWPLVLGGCWAQGWRDLLPAMVPKQKNYEKLIFSGCYDATFSSTSHIFPFQVVIDDVFSPHDQIFSSGCYRWYYTILSYILLIMYSYVLHILFRCPIFNLPFHRTGAFGLTREAGVGKETPHLMHKNLGC